MILGNCPYCNHIQYTPVNWAECLEANGPLKTCGNCGGLHKCDAEGKRTPTAVGLLSLEIEQAYQTGGPTGAGITLLGKAERAVARRNEKQCKTILAAIWKKSDALIVAKLFSRRGPELQARYEQYRQFLEENE